EDENEVRGVLPAVVSETKKKVEWEGENSIGLEGVADKGGFEQRVIASEGIARIQE
ncbi:38914_t:CDS:1, partial [Gigaspora margarita]